MTPRPACVDAATWDRMPVGRRGLLTAIEDHATRRARTWAVMDPEHAAGLLAAAAQRIEMLVAKWGAAA